jgi:hypothetical protein
MTYLMVGPLGGERRFWLERSNDGSAVGEMAY